MIFDKTMRFDVGKDAHRAQEMLINGIVMIHIELHHRDDLTEVGHEPAEHASFVHASQNRFGRVA